MKCTTHNGCPDHRVDQRVRTCTVRARAPWHDFRRTRPRLLTVFCPLPLRPGRPPADADEREKRLWRLQNSHFERGQRLAQLRADAEREKKEVPHAALPACRRPAVARAPSHVCSASLPVGTVRRAQTELPHAQLSLGCAH